MSLFGIGRRFYRGFKYKYSVSRRRVYRSALGKRYSRDYWRGCKGR